MGPIAGVTVSFASSVRLTCVLAAGCMLVGRSALAFPASDASAPAITVDTAEPTQSDLRHQLQLQSGFGASSGGGWTLVPSLTLQEAFTDNVLDTQTNRRWDLITFFTPGFTLVGDVPNAQVNLAYAPQVRLNARTSSQNQVTQQLLGSASFTVVPDLFYIDARAVAGGQAGAPGLGAVGLGVSSPINQQLNGVGSSALANRFQVQTNSFAVAPYLLQRFGDTGTGKIGYQLSYTSFSQANSSVPLFFQGGSSGSHNTTNEVVAQFETGERFAPFRNLTVVDGSIGNGTGVNNNSSQFSAINRLGYLVDRGLIVFAEVGYENLRFNGIPPTRIDDAVWGAGATLTPNEDSKITVSFGHRYGDNNFNLNASYALTPRTQISASYLTGLQSDLQTIQSQLDLASLDSTGRTVDSRTGAPLFIGTGGLGVQSGLFRVRALTATVATTLDRDQIYLTLQYSRNTTIATVPADQIFIFGTPPAPVGSTSTAFTGYLSWTHQLSEVLTLSSSAAFSTSQIPGTGTQQSVAANIGMQYLISDTVAVSAQYSFLDRISNTPGLSFTQNMVIVGISKQF